MTTAVTDSYFTTIEAADAVLAKRLGTAAWTAASTADKTAALQQATSVIDRLTYGGVVQSSTQEREFPRKYLVDPYAESPWGNIILEDTYGYSYESTDVPDDIYLACALEALALIEYYSSSNVVNEQELIEKGVKSFTLGKLSMAFNKSAASRAGFRSSEAYTILQDYEENSSFIE